MADIERLAVKIEADMSGLRAQLEASTMLMQQHSQRMAAAMTGHGGVMDALNSVRGGVHLFEGALAALGVHALGEAIKGSLEYADTLDKTAKRLGINVEALQEYRFAAKQSGVDQDTLDSGLQRLIVTLGRAKLGVSESAAAFKRLGLDPAAFRTSEAAIAAVLSKLAGLKDQAERNALAMQIFGREAGPRMASMAALGTAEIDRLRQSARDLGAVLDSETIDKAVKSQDKLEALAAVTKTQLTAALVDLAPVLVKVGEGFAFAAKGLNLLFDGVESAIKDNRIKTLKKELEDLQSGIKPEDASNAAMAEMFPDVTVPFKNAKEAVKDLGNTLRGFSDPYEAWAQRVQTPAGLSAEALARIKEIKAELKSLEEPASKPKDKKTRLANLTGDRPEDKEQQKKLEDLKKHLGNELEVITDGLMTEEERTKASWDKRRTIVSEALARGVIDQEKADGLLQQLEDKQQSEHLQKVFESVGMQKLAAQELADFEKLTAADKAQGILDITENLAGAFSQTSRRMFEVAKTASIANAVIHTYEAATLALSSSGNIYAGLAKAAVALAFGFAQVRAIQATHFGGAGGGVAAGSPSASSGGVGGGGFQGPGSGGSGGPNVYISLPAGQMFSSETVQALIEQISQSQGDGRKISVVS